MIKTSAGITTTKSRTEFMHTVENMTLLDRIIIPLKYKKAREMNAIRDTAIWSSLQEVEFDIAKVDTKTKVIQEVETNYNLVDEGDTITYKFGDEAVNTLTVL